MLIFPDNIPYLRRFIRNLRYHEPLDAKILKATSGISIKQALQINEKKDYTGYHGRSEKYMLNYKVGLYTKYEDISLNKRNIQEKRATIVYVHKTKILVDRRG